MRTILLSIVLASPTVSLAQQGIEECRIAMPSNLSEGNAAVARMREECLPKIRRISECVSRTRLLSEAVSGFITRFRKPVDQRAPLMVVASADVEHFDIKNSDINIWRNFLSLEAQYNQSLDTVKALAEKYKNISSVGTSTGMQAQLDALDHDYNETAKALARLSENEYKLLIFIENVKRDLEGGYSRTRDEALWLMSDACKEANAVANVSAVVLQIQGAFIKFTEDTDAIYQHIMSAKTARQNLINYTYTAIRSKIETAYSAHLVDELSTLGGKIDTTIRANRLSAKFENWYSWSAFEPERDKVLTIYQQFEASRRILAADLMSAQDFKEQMLAVSDPFPETAEFYLNRMDSVINNIDSRLQRLEAKGWPGYLSSQKASATRIVATPERISSRCLAMYRDFLDQAAGVDSLEKYRLSEKVFMNAVIACTRGPT